MGGIMEYGLYGGKEDEFDKKCLGEELEGFYEKGVLRVLGLNEIW